LKHSTLPHASSAPRPLPLPLLIATLCIGIMPALPVLPAYAAGPVVPGAGTILQQAEPVAPLAPPPNDTGLRIQQPSSGALPASIAIRVEHIEIVGNSKIDTQTLHALVADAEGRDLNLTQMGELATRITDYYHAHGFPLAHAIVPAQTMQSGAVKIEVIEARYGKIDLDNQSRVNDHLLQSTLADLQSGEVITQADMDRSLLLLADIPGLVVNATLKSGAQAGTSDLQVNATSAPMFSGNVTADNSGDRYTGRARLGANASVFDLLHQGDTLGVSALTAGDGMRYGRVSYDALLNGSGTRLGGAYSALDYKLRGSLSSLNAQGSAKVSSVWVRQPLIRGMRLNLNAQLEYDHQQLDDDIRSFGIQTDRHLDNVTASLSGNARDGLWGGGVSLWNAGLTGGYVGFDDATAQAVDALTADTQGNFVKGNVTLARLQNVSMRDTVYLSFSGQWASGNLDASQKLVVGGPNSVRAYDVGALSGDVGYTFTAELRHSIGQSWYGQWQAIAFVDAAHVAVNRNALVASMNNANLGGAGVGLNWIGPNQLSANLVLAVPVGPTPVQIGARTSARAWLQASKGF
jgi:hemolysin activation/secretion protein